MSTTPTGFTEFLALSKSERTSGSLNASLAAIDKALALQPRNAVALLMKADLLAELGDIRGSVSFYSAVTKVAASGSSSPLESAEARRAASMVERYAKEFEEHIRSKLEAQGLNQTNFPPRFAKALDILAGKKKAFQQEPRHLYFPELAPVPFFERADFPFLDSVEAAFEDIRAELESITAEASGFEPYVKSDASRPPSSQRGLADNDAWSAYFLIKDGRTTDGGHRCPQTLDALRGASTPNIPGHSPMVLFSRLKPRTRIPAHTGMINTRLICHLPLVVPPGCHFRVGNDVRAWQEGKAWVFDDTIEHEAVNQSASDRTILIFDIWRPDLSEDERAAFTALCVAVDAYAGTQSWD